MTKIQSPTPSNIAEAAVQEPNPGRAQPKQPAADTLAAPAHTPGPESLQLHGPIPPNLRPIHTQVPHHRTTFSPPGPAAVGAETSGGGQAEAVAHGSLGLVDLPHTPSSVAGGIWSSPLSHLGDISALSLGGQHSMATLAQIDHHLDTW